MGKEMPTTKLVGFLCALLLMTTNATVAEAQEGGPSSIQCSPTSAERQVGETHQIMCEVFVGDDPVTGAYVDAELLDGSANDSDGTSEPPDFSNLVTDELGQVQLSYPGKYPGTDDICIWVDENGVDDDINGGEGSCKANPGNSRVSVHWVSSSSPGEVELDCEPQEAVRTVGETHEIECSATQDDEPLEDVAISAELLKGSAHDTDGTSDPPDLTAVTGDEGRAVISYRPDDDSPGGTDAICLWIDEGGGEVCGEGAGTATIEVVWIPPSTGGGDTDLAAVSQRPRSPTGPFWQIRTEPAHPTVGTPSEFQVELINTGGEAAGPFSVAFVLNGNELGNFDVDGLGPGERRWIWMEWNPHRAGAHNLEVRIDRLNAVAESDESNNIVEYGFRVVSPARVKRPPPDIELDRLTFSPLGAGESHTFRAYITSHRASTRSEVLFFLDGRRLGPPEEVQLAPNQQLVVTSREWVADRDRHRLRAVVDYDDQVSETNEDNNDRSLKIEMQDKEPTRSIAPDLRVDRVDAHNRPGDRYSISARVCNVGRLLSFRSVVGFEAGSEHEFETFDVGNAGPLFPDECREISAPWRASGHGRVPIRVSASAIETEDILTNNRDATSVEVRARTVRPPRGRREPARHLSITGGALPSEQVEAALRAFVIKTSYRATAGGPIVESYWRPTIGGRLDAIPSTTLIDLPERSGIDLTVDIVPVIGPGPRLVSALIDFRKGPAPSAIDLRAQVLAKDISKGAIRTVSDQNACGNPPSPRPDPPTWPTYSSIGFFFPGEYSAAPVSTTVNALFPDETRTTLRPAVHPGVKLLGGTLAGYETAGTFVSGIGGGNWMCLPRTESKVEIEATGYPGEINIDYRGIPQRRTGDNRPAPYRSEAAFKTLDYWANGPVEALTADVQFPVGDDDHALEFGRIHATGVPEQLYLSWADQGRSEFYMDTGARGYEYTGERNGGGTISMSREAPVIPSVDVDMSNKPLPLPTTLRQGRTEPAYLIMRDMDPDASDGGTNQLAAHATNVRYFHEFVDTELDAQDKKTFDLVSAQAWFQPTTRTPMSPNDFYGSIIRSDGTKTIEVEPTVVDMPAGVGFTSYQTYAGDGETVIGQDYGIYGSANSTLPLGAGPDRPDQDSQPTHGSVNFTSPHLGLCVGGGALAQECPNGMWLRVDVPSLPGGVAASLRTPSDERTEVVLRTGGETSDVDAHLINADPPPWQLSGGFSRMDFTDMSIPRSVSFSSNEGDTRVHTDGGVVSGEVFISERGEIDWTGSPARGTDTARNAAHVKVRGLKLVGLAAKLNGLDEVVICSGGRPLTHPQGECVYRDQRSENRAYVSIQGGGTAELRYDRRESERLIHARIAEAPPTLDLTWDLFPDQPSQPNAIEHMGVTLDTGDARANIPYLFLGLPTEPAGFGVLVARDISTQGLVELTSTTDIQRGSFTDPGPRIFVEVPTGVVNRVDGEDRPRMMELQQCPGDRWEPWLLRTINVRAREEVRVGFLRLTTLEKENGRSPHYTIPAEIVTAADVWGNMQITSLVTRPSEARSTRYPRLPHPRDPNILIYMCTKVENNPNPETHLTVNVAGGEVMLHLRQYKLFWSRRLAPNDGSAFDARAAHQFQFGDPRVDDLWEQRADLQMCYEPHADPNARNLFWGFFNVDGSLGWNPGAYSRQFTGRWRLAAFYTPLSTQFRPDWLGNPNTCYLPPDENGNRVEMVRDPRPPHQEIGPGPMETPPPP